MTDITAVGELLIDFTEAGLEETGDGSSSRTPAARPQIC